MARDDRPSSAAASVCWFAPLQLLRTGQQVAIATIFGRNADARIIEALSPPEVVIAAEPLPAGQAEAAALAASAPPFHDYADEPAPFWIDYAADTGDGWNATATIAYHLARDTLMLQETPGSEIAVTRRGSLLVFGGDEVYPAASFEAYEQRLLLPFRTMFPPRSDETELKDAPEEEGGPLRTRPDVFAVPGNHDWYDSLVSFTRLFCSKQGFAGWRAPQRRSYFALRLPRGWWLLGTDLQLGSDIDAQQEAFFQELAGRIGENDRIIICHAEPHWLYETIYPSDYSYRGVHRLEERFGDRIKVSLAGDYHFYTRHEAADGRQKIVAGGGGAFLHLTAGPDDRRLRETPGVAGSEAAAAPVFERRCCFPSRPTSVRLGLLGPLTVHARNPSFGAATAVAYAVTGEALVSPVLAAIHRPPLWDEVVGRLFTDPFSLFWVATVILGVIFFTDTHKRWYRWTAGPIHALCHIAAAAILARASATAAGAWLEGSLWRFPAAAAGTALGGYVVGPLILSVYLTVSILVFGRHREEASSGLRCPDYKNVLRLCIGPEGDLTIYPVGIRRVARRWRRATQPEPGIRSSVLPVGGADPHLIESPIRYPPARPQGSPGDLAA